MVIIEACVFIGGDEYNFQHLPPHALSGTSTYRYVQKDV